MLRRAVVGVLVAMLAVPVMAGELAGVTMPDQVTVSGNSLVLNGMGLRKKLWIKVYVGGLYLKGRTHDAAEAVNAPGAKRMVMHFLTNKATKSKMDDAWMEGFENNNPEQWDALRGRVEQFISFFGDMRDGTDVEMTIEPETGVTVLIDGQVKGAIQGEDFAKALLNVWLGPEPPSDDFKEGVLGQ